MCETRLKNYHKSLLILLFFFLYSCDRGVTHSGLSVTPIPTLSYELMDRSWLTDQPCLAPCWYGLSLGITPMSIAKEKVTQLSFIDAEIIKESSSVYVDPLSEEAFDADDLIFYCKQPNQSVCSILKFLNNQLVEININLNYHIELEEVVDIIGTPDLLRSSPVFGNDCMIDLVWINRQIEIDYFENRTDKCETMQKNGEKPSPNLTIHEVWYRLPDYFINLETEHSYVPWAGFAQEK